jgi:hypothetical protein
MTDAERQYFQTGQVTDALAQGEEQQQPAEQPIDVDEHGEPEVPVQGQEAPQGDDRRPRRIGFTKYQQELDARRAAEQQLHEQQLRNARVEERLNLLSQALQQPEQQVPAEEVPDPEKDIFAYVRYLERQHALTRDKVDAYEQQLNAQQAEAEMDGRYINALNEYAGSDPNFMQAYAHLMTSRKVELMARQYPRATLEQLLRAPMPAPIQQQIVEEERDLYRSAFENGQDPGAQIVQLARVRGWTPQQAQQAAPQQAAPQQARQAPQQNGLRNPPQAQPGRSVSEIVEGIKNGQRAATSLSNVSGSSGAGLTPQALADMSDADFNALYTALSERGDKQKLMELFGA